MAEWVDVSELHYPNDESCVTCSQRCFYASESLSKAVKVLVVSYQIKTGHNSDSAGQPAARLSDPNSKSPDQKVGE